MALNFGIKALQPGSAANLPHVLGFSTPRSTAGDTLFEIWNGSTNAAKKFSVDKDGVITGDGSGITKIGTLSTLNVSGGITLGGDVHSESALGVVTAAGQAQQWRAGSLLVSNSFADSNLVPANGAYIKGALTVAGTISGPGSGITALNASNLASGTVPSARLAGAYTGITGLGTLTGLTVGGKITVNGTDGILIHGQSEFMNALVVHGIPEFLSHVKVDAGVAYLGDIGFDVTPSNYEGEGTSGGHLYCNGGALKWVSYNGTTTVLAPA